MIHLKPTGSSLSRCFHDKTYSPHVTQRLSRSSTSTLSTVSPGVEADGKDRFATDVGTQLTLAVYSYVVAHQLLYEEYEMQHLYDQYPEGK